MGPDADGSAITQQFSYLRGQIDSLQEELLKEKEASRIAAERLRQTEESFEQKEEGYESQITLLNSEIERQATNLESLRMFIPPLSLKDRSSKTRHRCPLRRLECDRMK